MYIDSNFEPHEGALLLATILFKNWLFNFCICNFFFYFSDFFIEKSNNKKC